VHGIVSTHFAVIHVFDIAPECINPHLAVLHQLRDTSLLGDVRLQEVFNEGVRLEASGNDPADYTEQARA